MKSIRNRAFTLIELIFVVATISILAAISVPNFLEAQVRAKVARVRVDMSVINVGLNRYYADYGAYPHNTTETQTYLDSALRETWMEDLGTSQTINQPIVPGAMPFLYYYRSTDINPSLQANRDQLYLLTTPIAYLESHVPTDLFSYNRHEPYLYINSYEVFANDSLTTHPGLWGDHLSTATHTVLASPGPDNVMDFVHPLSGPWVPYEPTNGTVSGGDIFQFEGRALRYVEPPVNPNKPVPADDNFGMGMI